MKRLMKFNKEPKLPEDPEEAIHILLNRSPVVGPFRAVQGLGKLMDRAKVPATVTPEFQAIREGLMKERDLYEKLLLGRK